MATLLIIEDDAVVRNVLCEVLSETYDCHTADRAEQALEYLEVESYDVILTDLMMPGLGGAEVVKRVLERHPDTPIIIISGTSGNERETLLELGAFAYIQKPFQLEDVEVTIVRALASQSIKKEDRSDLRVVNC